MRAASSAPSPLNLLPFGLLRHSPVFRTLQARGRQPFHTSKCPCDQLSRALAHLLLPQHLRAGEVGEVKAGYTCKSQASPSQRGGAGHPPGSTWTRCCPCSAPFPSGTPFPLSGLTSKGPTCDSFLWPLQPAWPVQGSWKCYKINSPSEQPSINNQ